MTDTSRLLAVLIDADNTPPSAAEAIFDEISTFGQAAVRRVYGDFTSSHLNGWSKEAPKLALLPYHQPANTVGKNSSDIALVIDGMDLLHSGRFDGFVIVSSDSDFTRLASRIREQGLFVCGVGRANTPDAFRQACQRFILIENLGKQETNGQSDQESKDPHHAYQLISNVLRMSESDDGWTNLSALGQALRQRYPDFDPRSYGASSLSKLVRRLNKLQLRGGEANLEISLKDK